MIKHRTKSLLLSTLLISILILGIAGAKPDAKTEYEDEYVLDVNNTLDHLWSPDGDQIAFTTCQTGQWWNCDLWVSDSQLDNPMKILTGIRGNGLFDWYDGWLLFELYPVYPAVLNPDGTATSGELWKIRPDGSELTKVTSTQTNGIRRVFWNPFWDGRGTVAWGQFVRGTDMVYFVAHDGNGWWGPHLTTSDGSDQWRRILPYSYAFTYGYTPVCDTLLWGHTSYYNQPTTLYRSNGDGSNGGSIAHLGVISWPVLLSDCQTILLSWPGSNIYAIGMDGTNLRPVLVDEYTNSINQFNPLEGKAFVITSNRFEDGNSHLYKMYVDDDYMMRLTDGPYDHANPNYSPDGKFMLFTRLSATFDPASGDPYPYQLVVKDMVPVEIDGLTSIIHDLSDPAHLSKGQVNSLLVKLAAALKQYKHGHAHTAINILHAFVNHVNDLVEEGVLPESDGQNLVYHAGIISEMIG